MRTRVLVIDDEAPIRLLCRVNLEAEGMSVIEAEDGPRGLAAAREARPDVVLLDVQLPDTDGFAICEGCLDRNGYRPKIVLVSSRDAADYGDLIASSGAQGFIPKAELSGEALTALVG